MSRRRIRFRRLLERIDLHAGNFFAAEGLRAKLSYLGTKSIRLRHRGHLHFKKFRQNVLDRGFRPIAGTLRKLKEASQKATVRYQPKPYQGRVTLFRASKQPAGVYPDPELGWSAIAGGGIEIHEVLGHHGAVVYEPRVGILARELARCLEKAYARQAQATGTISP